MCEATSTKGATIKQRIIDDRYIELGMLRDSADWVVDDERAPRSH